MNEDMKMAYDNCAQQAAGTTLAQAGQNIAQKIQPPIRERIQEANKRAVDISGKLSSLIDAVLPPALLANANNYGSETVVKDSTLSGDVDELARTLSRIDQYVTRLAVAIGG